MITTSRLWTGLAVVFAAAALAVMNWPAAAPTPATTVARPAPMAAVPLAPPAPVDPGAELALLQAARLWGEAAAAPGPAAAASAAAAPAAPWFVSGVYGTPQGRRAVLHFEGKAQPSRQLAVGDKLPDDRRIVAIEPDRVAVRAAGATKPAWLPINRGIDPAAKSTASDRPPASNQNPRR